MLENNKTAVFKFEQLEGHSEVIRKHFPTAIHLGLLRNRQSQFDSWLEQLALGNSGFFDGARKLVLEDPDYFTNGVIIENPTDREVFELYHSKLIQLSSKFDLIFNLYEDDREKFLSKIAPNTFQEIFSLAFERLDKLGNPPTFEKKFNRMKQRSLTLTQQRDELTQQRDELIQQRDELINSTIWKMTYPLRIAINFFKK
jgi:hypothetical protein